MKNAMKVGDIVEVNFDNSFRRYFPPDRHGIVKSTTERVFGAAYNVIVKLIPSGEEVISCEASMRVIGHVED